MRAPVGLNWQADDRSAGAGCLPAGGEAALDNTVTTVRTVQTDETGKRESTLNAITGCHVRQAFSFENNIAGLLAFYGSQTAVFGGMTLKNINGLPPTHDQAKARWRKFEKLVVQSFPLGGVEATERGATTGRLHFHPVIFTGCDVREGYDYSAAEIQRGKSHGVQRTLHRSANVRMQAAFRTLKRLAKVAGFGHCFFEPVKGDAVACYAAKYITKNIAYRIEDDRGRRMVSYFGASAQRRVYPSGGRFAFGGSLTRYNWATGQLEPDFRNGGAWLRRAKRAQWAKDRGHTEEMLARPEFKGWQYRNRHEIARTRLENYPYWYLWEMDHCGGCDLSAYVRVLLPPLLSTCIKFTRDEPPIVTRRKLIEAAA
jgi:hypothetical protein